MVDKQSHSFLTHINARKLLLHTIRNKCLLMEIKLFFSIPDLPTVSRTKFLNTHVQVEAVQRLLHQSYNDLLHSESKTLSRRRVEC